MPLTLRRLPNGSPIDLPDEAGIGRATFMTMVIDDELIATSHAEISPRAEGLTLLATRGEVRVDGRSVRSVLIRPGQRWWFAPGVELEVLQVNGVAEPVPATLPAFVWTLAPEEVLVSSGAYTCNVGGQQATLLRHLLADPGRGHPWEPIARIMLPGSAYQLAKNQRRFGDAFDFHQKALCKELESFRAVADPQRESPMVWKQRGLVYLRWNPFRDRVEER